MVAPGFLQSPEVRRWLNGVEPAWTMLDYASYAVLHQEPLPGNEAIKLEPNLTEKDLADSAVTHTAQILLRHAADTGGLKLTATGNLSRAVVAELIGIIEWPDLDRAGMFQFHKVINEPDFLPVYFVRTLLQATKLLRRSGDKVVPTRLGKKMLSPEQQGVLQALLFHTALWHVNLGYFARNSIDPWPQNHVGIVLWSLSASAADWMHCDKMTRLCTVPTIGVVQSAWDLGPFAMETRILRPLAWFGLLERRTEGEVGLGVPHLYRKTPLFDRFVKLDVTIERPATRN